VGGVIGAVTGAIQAARAGKGPGQILLHALWGSVKGSHIALASVYGGPWAGAGAAACFATLESLVQTGGNLKQAFIAGNVAFGMSLASSGFSSLMEPVGQAAASAATTAVGQAMAQSAVQFATSTAMSYGYAAMTGSLNGENWDDILLDNAISATISTVGNVVGAEVGGVGGEEAGIRKREPRILSGGPNDQSAGGNSSTPPKWDKEDWEGQDVVLIAHSKDQVALVKNWAKGLKDAGAKVTTYTGGKKGDFSYAAYAAWAKGHEGQYDTALVFGHGSADQGGQLFFGSPNRSNAVGPNTTPERFKEYSASLMYLTKDKGNIGFYVCNLGRGGDNSFLGKFYNYAQQYPGTGRNVHGFQTKYQFYEDGSGVGSPLAGMKQTSIPRSVFNWNRYSN